MNKDKINDKIKKLESQLKELKQEVNKEKEYALITIEKKINALRSLGFEPKAIYVNDKGAWELRTAFAFSSLGITYSPAKLEATYKGIPITQLSMEEKVIVGF